jgi:arylsulfatase A-like enzyme
LVQTFDLAPTVLEFFGQPVTKDMLGRPLRDVIAKDTPIRNAGLFGCFGGQVNVTDGRYVYMRGPARDDSQPLFQYTHMPTHMRRTFDVSELQDIQLAEPFSFTKGCRTMKIPGQMWAGGHMDRRTLLFDLATDPGQKQPLKDPQAEKLMIDHLLRLLRENDAPQEQFARLGLT